MSRPDRATVWRVLGEPSEQLGSVNEPRRQLEDGHAWNEKWIHRDRRGEIERVVLWDRYDLVGVFRPGPDGSLVPEPFPGEEGRAPAEGAGGAEGRPLA